MNLKLTKQQRVFSAAENALRAVGCAQAGELTFRRLRVSHDRRDEANPDRYLVAVGESACALLVAGENLDGLAAKARVFEAAYPELSCKVLGEGVVDGITFLLTEYFDGVDGAVALQHPQFGPEFVAGAVERIASVFERGTRPSTHAGVVAEITEFCRKVDGLPYWTPADRSFLDKVVFPFLHQRLGQKPLRRVTNGDLILRNILVRSDGEIRVVDYEYVSDTHLFEEDWVRIGYWDVLPERLRRFLDVQVLEPAPLRLYLCLRQLVLEEKVNRPKKATADAIHWCNEVKRLIAESTNELTQSMLWPRADLGAASERHIVAQLFWSGPEGAWSAERSVGVSVSSFEIPVRLVFAVQSEQPPAVIRFDPSEVPCLVTLHSILLREASGAGTILWREDFRSATNSVFVTGDAHVESSEPGGGLVLIVTGADPQVHIPGIGVRANGPLVAEALVTYSLDHRCQANALRSLVHRLQGSAEAERIVMGSAVSREVSKLGAQVEGERDRSEAHHQAIMTALTERESECRQKIENLELSLRSSRTERIHELEETGRLVAEQAGALEKIESINRELDQSRILLSNYAKTIDRLELVLSRSKQEALSRENDRQSGNAEMSRLTSALAASEVKIELLEKENGQCRLNVANYAKSIDRLELALIRRDQDLTVLQAEVVQLERAEANLKGSMSWKVTGPLRFVYDRLPRKR